MFLLGSLNTAAFSTPGHNRCIRSQSSFERFIPSDHAASLFIQELFCLMNHIALQTFFFCMFGIRLQSQCLDAGLTFRTFFPLGLRTFVTAHMDIFRREDIHDLSQYILHKLNGLIISGTENIVRNTPLTPYFIRTSGTSQFRISSQGSLHVTGQVDFRNNGNVTFCCISNDFPGIFLSIEAAVRLSVVFAGIAADHGFRTF